MNVLARAVRHGVAERLLAVSLGLIALLTAAVSAVDNAGNVGESVSVEGFEIQTTVAEEEVIDIK